MAGGRSSAVPVIAFGGGVTLLGALRGLGRARIPVHIGSETDEFVLRSRWARPLPGALPKSATVEGLAAWLDGLRLPRAVLLPCSDVWAVLVAGLPARLQGRFPASAPSLDVVETLVDKGRFERALDACGVAHPRTVALQRPEDLDRVPVDLLASAFLKPRNSNAFIARFGVKAFHFKDRADAVTRWAEADRAGFAMVLQEYVPGPPTCHHFIDGFMDREGRVRACFARRRLRMFPLDFGNSTYMISIPWGEIRPAVESLIGLLRSLRYRGVFSAEFKQDPRDGVHKILEVNARPWWYVGFAEACGVNVCRLAYLDALGADVPAIHRYAIGRRCVFPRRDVEASRVLKGAAALSRSAMLRSWIGASQPILALDDPLPFVHETRGYLARVLARLTGRAAPVPAGGAA